MTNKETLTADERAAALRHEQGSVTRVLAAYDIALAESRDLIAQRDTALGLCKERERELMASRRDTECANKRGDLIAEERDAALSRAEAAQNNAETYARIAGERLSAQWAAESALAEARALLDEIRAKCKEHNEKASVCHGADYHFANAVGFVAVQAILSRTPAPAAKAEPDLVALSVASMAHLRHYGADLGPWVESVEARLAEHPDTIALRECRVECQKRLDATNAMREALESARAERDMARAEEHKSAGDARLWKSRYEDECRARTVSQSELERLHGIIGQLQAGDMKLELEALTASRALVERIEAELKSVRSPNVHAKVDRALAILRAAKEGT